MGNSASNYVLSCQIEGIIDTDWVPDARDLWAEWYLVANDDSHLWNAPF